MRKTLHNKEERREKRTPLPQVSLTTKNQKNTALISTVN